jgi:hypothetical protein
MRHPVSRTSLLGRRVALALGASLLLATAPAAAHPSAAAGRARDSLATHRFAPSADTYVSTSSRRKSFGSRGMLAVSRSPRRIAYLRFDLAGLTGEVVRARLLLYPTRRGGRFRIAPTSGDWSESTAYRAAPRGTGSAFAARSLRRTWTSVDVTRLVGGSGQLNLLLQGVSTRALTFASRERPARAPRLVVDVRPGLQPAPPVSDKVRPQPPPAPPPAPGNRYAGHVGVASGMVWYPEDEQLAYLRSLRAGGVTWVRSDFSWGAHERSPGVWNWDVGDKFMRSAATAGVNVLGVLGYSAAWAASGPTIYHPPRDFGQYANFCRVLVDRYGTGGDFWRANPGLTPRPLQAVEIWNEPWSEHFWRPLPDPSAYARLVQTAATAIRQSHPEVKILASADIFQSRSDTPESLDWFRPLARDHAGVLRDFVDAYSVHLYTQSRSPLDTVTPQRWRFDRLLMSRDLARAAGADHPLWITEFGWSTYAGHRDSVSEDTQARYIREALKLAVEDWGGFVPVSFVYHYGRASDDFGGGFSLQRPNGSMKPAWSALTALLAAQ